MADLTSVAALLKEIWAPAMETAFNQEVVGIARVERTSDGVRTEVSGRYVVIPVHVGRNQGIGSRPERGILPLPGKQNYVGALVKLRHQYGVGDVTSQMLDLADGDPKSFVNTQDREMDGITKDVAKDYARQFYGTNTGTIGTVSAVAGNDVTVDKIQYFEEEMLLDSVTAATDTVTASNREVTAINTSTKVVTLDDATGVLVGDVLVRHGNYQQEINGLTDLIAATGAVQNLDPATDTRRWASFSEAMGGAFNEVNLVKAVDRVRREVGGQPVSAFFTGDGGWRTAYSSLLADRQFHNTVEFAFGVQGIPFFYKGRQIPIVSDPDFPEETDATTTEYIGVTEEHMAVYRHPKGWHFAEESGAMFIPAADRSDAFEYRIRQFSQVGIELRNSHVRVTGITV